MLRVALVGVEHPTHEFGMSKPPRDLIREHLPEATRYLEQMLGKAVDRVNYDGTHCIAFLPGGQVDCTDALRAWAEEHLPEFAPAEPSIQPNDTRRWLN